MEMREKDTCIRQISLGIYFIEYKNELFVYKEPDEEFILLNELYYKTICSELKKEGFFTAEEESQRLKDRGLWTDEDEKEITQISKDIDQLRSKKKDYQFQSQRLKQISELIKVAEEELLKKYQVKNTFYNQTVEYRAQLESYQHLLSHCLHRADNTRVWGSFDDFQNDSSIGFINYCIDKLFANPIFPEKQLREIARTEPWRTKWRLGKNSDALFSRSTCNYTKWQHNLCYWSMVYDSVFESIDCPDQETINDDDLLNEWLIVQHKKHEDERRGRSNSTEISSNPKIRNASEVFVKVDTADDAQKVYNLNDATARRKLRTRQLLISKKGEVKETHLPDVQQELRMQVTQATMSKVTNS